MPRTKPTRNDAADDRCGFDQQPNPCCTRLITGIVADLMVCLRALPDDRSTLLTVCHVVYVHAKNVSKADVLKVTETDITKWVDELLETVN